MKIKNMLMAAAAIFTMGFVASCDNDYEPTLLSSVQVSSSFVSLEAAGSSASIKLTSASEWYFELSKADSAWLTVTPGNGKGNAEVTFSAEASTTTHSTTILLHCGKDVQRINVLQQCAKVELPISSCATAMSGEEGTSYRVKGAVTKIASDVYGNMYLNDGSGVEAYIYGTLDAKGAEKNFASLGIEVGDVVTVEGPLAIYNGTYELKNVTVINIEKSLIKCDSLSVDTVPVEGGSFVAYLTNKGDGITVNIPEDAKSWLAVTGISTSGTSAEVTFQATANEGGDRETTLSFTTTQKGKTYTSQAVIAQKGSVVAVTCAKFNALSDGIAQYTVHGVITKIANDLYGNIYINDGTGEVYVYGVLDANGATKNFASLGLKVGDEVVLQSVKTSYNGAAQMKNAVVVETVAHETKTVAELKELADDKDTYYYVSGVVCHAEEASAKFDLQTYGNFGLKDETGTIYVYGVADALDGVTKNFAATGVKEGDTITILAYKTSYNGTNELVGKFIKNEPAKVEE